MEFCERLRKMRETKGLTQEQLANISGITVRMIQQYEHGKSKPRYEASTKLAKALDVSITTLLGENDQFIAEAGEQYGPRGQKQATELLREVTGLFAGGKLAEEDMDAWMKAIQDAYWAAKENNKKYRGKDN